MSQVGASIDALERQFEIIAHNMANTGTVGFKRRCNNFTEEITAQSAEAEGAADPDPSQGPVDFSQGTLVQTDRTLDVALHGKGFFVLESPEGPLYTRHGVFQTNRNGQIVDTMGRLVAGTGGPVLVPPNVDVADIRVDGTGRISAGQAALGQLQIVEFGAGEARLIPVGTTCFRAPADVRPVDATDVSVRQGYEEASNVKIIDELVNMIMVSRMYEANMKLMTANRETSNSAISVAMA